MKITRQKIADYCGFNLHPLSNINSDEGRKYNIILGFVTSLGLLSE